MEFWTERRLNAITIFLAIILVLLAASNFIKVEYYITSPGVAMPLDQVITVEKGTKNAEGAFYLTAVSSRQASVFNYVYIKLMKPRGIELSTKKESLPENISMDQYVKIMEDMMRESQLFAKYVGLKEMGYQTKISGHGAEIVEIMETSKAKGILKSGDVITAVDGKKVQLSTEAVTLIQKHHIGEKVNLHIQREKKSLDVKVPTVELKDNPKKASIGIYIMTYERQYSFPLNIDIATSNIIGPSAGTMFTLEIINQLDPEDLTKGYQIAGTGTIDMDGIVGPIDGVEQKVIASERQGAEYFLAPAENYKDAVKAARTIKVVKMHTVDEALKFLRNLPAQQP